MTLRFADRPGDTIYRRGQLTVGWEEARVSIPHYSEKGPSAFYWAVVKMNFARMRCFWLTLKFILNVDISCENFASFCR